MEEDSITEELEIVLGLKNKKEKLKKIIDNSKKHLAFLYAVNEILKNENSNELYEKEIDIENDQRNGMLNFIQKFDI